MAVADSPTARYGDLCRLCATKTGMLPKGLNIFANEANYRQIFKKIEACLPLQISEADVLPKIVCENCLFKIELLFDFRERAVRTEGVLIELFKQLHSHPMPTHNAIHHTQHIKLDAALDHVISQHNGLLTDSLSHVSDIDLPQLSHRESMIILHSVPLDQLSQHDISQELSNNSIDTSESILGTNGYSAMDYHHPAILQDEINLQHANMHQVKSIVDHDQYTVGDLGHIKNGTNSGQRLMMNEAHFMHNHLTEEDNFDSLNSYLICTTCGKSFDDKILLQQHYEEHYIKICNPFTHEKELENLHRKELHGSPPIIDEVTPEEIEEHEPDKSQKVVGVTQEDDDLLPVHLDIPMDSEPDLDQIEESECLKSEQYSDADSEVTENKTSQENENNEDALNTKEENVQEVEQNVEELKEEKSKPVKKGMPKICSVCGKQYKTNYKLNEHMRNHTGELPYKCKSCDKGFKSKIGLAQHEATHTGQFDLSCDICGKGFQNKSYLMVHRRTHSDTKPYSCTTCNHSFKSKQSLLDHTNRHLGIKPFECEICHRTFLTNHILKSHKKIHSGEDLRKYACPVCGKMFVRKHYLQTHTRIHTGEKPHKCEVCGKGFQARVDLKVHSTMHTGEKSYVCEMCGKAFARRDSLKCHARSHTGERPYKCDICGQTFTQYSPMVIHKRLHTGERPYECEQCGSKFTSRSTMMVHVKRHLKNDVKNEIGVT